MRTMRRFQWMGWLDTYTTKPPYLCRLYKTPLTQSHLQRAPEIIAKWPVAPSRGISVAVLQSSVNTKQYNGRLDGGKKYSRPPILRWSRSDQTSFAISAVCYPYL